MPPGHWDNKDNCRDEALRYRTRSDFELGNYAAYCTAKRNDWLGEICAHMPPPHQLVPSGFWTKKENCLEMALKYSTRNELKKNANGAYRSALRNGWIEEICAHMVPTNRHMPGHWDVKENCRLEALKYSIRFDFQKGSSGAYEAAKRNGWMDEVCAHMAAPRTAPPARRTYERILTKIGTQSRSNDEIAATIGLSLEERGAEF